jgi:uncharacterized membrane protein YoaT (DUF817 family)
LQTFSVLPAGPESRRLAAAARAFLWEFFIFGLKEARSCIFAGSFFAVLLLSKYIPLFGLPRYDFICIAALVLQAVLLWTRIESKDEALVLCAFHVLGLLLELFNKWCRSPRSAPGSCW